VDKDGNEHEVPAAPVFGQKKKEIEVEIFIDPAVTGRYVRFKNPVQGHTSEWIKFHDTKNKVNALWLRVVNPGNYPANYWFYPAKKKEPPPPTRAETMAQDMVIPIDPNPPVCWCTDDNGFQVAGTIEVPPCCLINGNFVCNCTMAEERATLKAQPQDCDPCPRYDPCPRRRCFLFRWCH
jgi:hypothetical protein